MAHHYIDKHEIREFTFGIEYKSGADPVMDAFIDNPDTHRVFAPYDHAHNARIDNEEVRVDPVAEPADLTGTVTKKRPPPESDASQAAQLVVES